MKLAAELNTAAVDVVSLQHEFGLYGPWGDPYDAHLTGFLEVLRKPLVTTLHSVLRIRRQPYARRLSASGGAAKRSSSRPSRRARCSSTTTFFTRLSYYTSWPPWPWTGTWLTRQPASSPSTDTRAPGMRRGCPRRSQ